jgi:hypothetical protein
MPTFEDRGCRIVSTTDLYSRILCFLDRSRYYFFQVAPQLYSQGWVGPFQTHYVSENVVVPGEKSSILWDITPCSPLDINLLFPVLAIWLVFLFFIGLLKIEGTCSLTYHWFSTDSTALYIEFFVTASVRVSNSTCFRQFVDCELTSISLSVAAISVPESPKVTVFAAIMRY